MYYLLTLCNEDMIDSRDADVIYCTINKILKPQKFFGFADILS